MLPHPTEIGAQRLDEVGGATLDAGAGSLRFRIDEDVIELGELPWRRRAVKRAAGHRHDALAEPYRLAHLPLTDLGPR